MKRIITLCILATPFLGFSQGYKTSFKELIDMKDGSTDKINASNQDFNSSDPTTLANAVITITKVPPGEATSIEVNYVVDNKTKIVKSRTLDGDSLIFHLKDVIEPAEGKFQVFYKKLSKGSYVFHMIDGTGTDKTTGNTSEGKSITDYVGVMANVNFVGNNKFLSNLTPIVTMGIITTLYKRDTVINTKKRSFTWSLDVNPFLGAQIDTKDSVSFIPALMLPSRAGLILNNYLTWQKDKLQFTFMPLGFGLKLIPNVKDSNTIIFQHNFRTGIALCYTDVFLIGAQYTYGFHNTTSESEHFYKKIFSKNATDISYLTISGQFYVKTADDKKNFLYIEWRGLTSKKSYAAFTNNSIITIGYRSDLSLTHVFAAATGKDLNRFSAF